MAADELLNWMSASDNEDNSTQYITWPSTLVTSSVSHDDATSSDNQETTWDHVVGGVVAYLVLVLGLIVLVVLQYIKRKPFTLILKQEETDIYTVSWKIIEEDN